MKKVLFLFSLILFLGLPAIVSAQTTASAQQQINAQILPSIWYSVLPITEGENLQIFAGIQNNSGIDFDGTATFFVDGKPIAETKFSSVDNSLKDVSADWTAVVGVHSVQVKIIATIPTDKTLISYASDKSSITIAKKVTAAPVPDSSNTATTTPITTTSGSISDTVSNAVSQVNQYANTAANQLLTLKKAPPVSPKTKTSTPTKSGLSPDSVTNTVIDFLASALRNWGWSLGFIFAIFLLIKIGKSRKN